LIVLVGSSATDAEDSDVSVELSVPREVPGRKQREESIKAEEAAPEVKNEAEDLTKDKPEEDVPEEKVRNN
jgi:hypothetical protein